MVSIMTPFPHVTQHVEQPEIVGQQATTRLSVVARRESAPCIPPQQVHTRTIIAASPRSRPAGVLPFRLGGQPIAPQAQGIGLDLHAIRILATLVRLVALGEPLPTTEPVAESGGIIPGDFVHRTIRVGTVYVILCVIDPRVLLHEQLILPDRDFLSSNSEAPGDDPMMGVLLKSPTWLGRRRAHEELDRTFDHGEGLPLTIHKPPPLAPILDLH